MQPTLRAALILLALAALLLGASFFHRRAPRAWWSGELAGLALTRGGYESWTLRFCDGYALIDGKLKPVVIVPGATLTNNTYRVGRYFPRYRHLKLHTLATPSVPSVASVPSLP